MAGDEDSALPARPGHSVNNNLPGYALPAEPVLLFSYRTLLLLK